MGPPLFIAAATHGVAAACGVTAVHRAAASQRVATVHELATAQMEAKRTLDRHQVPPESPPEQPPIDTASPPTKSPLDCPQPDPASPPYRKKAFPLIQKCRTKLSAVLLATRRLAHNPPMRTRSFGRACPYRRAVSMGQLWPCLFRKSTTSKPQQRASTPHCRPQDCQDAWRESSARAQGFHPHKPTARKDDTLRSLTAESKAEPHATCEAHHASCPGPATRPAVQDDEDAAGPEPYAT